MLQTNLSRFINAAQASQPLRVYGRITEITGITIKATGIKASVGEACKIYSDNQMPIDAEVVGFKDSKALLMATGDISWIKPNSRILTLGKKVSIKVGDGLIGRVIDESGHPIDGKGQISGFSFPLMSTPPNPMSRERISEPIDLGVAAINGLLTVGKGQRIGIMSGAG
ncbi:MAG: hypothetical protein HQK97_09735, partial [Nitrospirae bacterium]|nr:hypothetical protein [Nitrospirota bacterium]